MRLGTGNAIISHVKNKTATLSEAYNLFIFRDFRFSFESQKRVCAPVVAILNAQSLEQAKDNLARLLNAPVEALEAHKIFCNENVLEEFPEKIIIFRPND